MDTDGDLAPQQFFETVYFCVTLKLKIQVWNDVNGYKDIFVCVYLHVTFPALF